MQPERDLCRQALTVRQASQDETARGGAPGGVRPTAQAARAVPDQGTAVAEAGWAAPEAAAAWDWERAAPGQAAAARAAAPPPARTLATAPGPRGSR